MNNIDELAQLAENTESVGTLLLLTLNSSPRIRRATASNLSCPLVALVALSADNDMRVRAAVASHPRTPHHVIQRYIDDSGESVSVRTLALLNDHSFVERLCAMDLKQLDAYTRHEDLSYARAALNELSKRQHTTALAVTL